MRIYLGDACDLLMESSHGNTIGDLLSEALTTGLYPVADSSIVSGFDEDFDSNNPDSWYVDPLNRFDAGVGDLLQSGALHRSSLSEVKAPSSVSASDTSDSIPTAPSSEVTSPAGES